MESTHAKILVVEDESAIGVVIKDTLTDSGYRCKVVSDGLVGLREALAEEYDLVLLDVNLPSLSGLDICRELKSVRPQLPVLLLTARSEEADVVTGLEIGADDYICKPFKPRELVARIRVRLRERTRTMLAAVSGREAAEQPAQLRLGELVIDFEKMRIEKRGVVLEITAREFEFISLLATYPGRPFTREELLAAVWEVHGEGYGPNVSVFVSRLRRKLEDDPDNPRYLHTVRGVGYKFTDVLSDPE